MSNAFFKILKYRFNLDEDKAEEEEIISSIRRNVEFKGTNLWGLIFAIFIASIGLNVNSTAVIIGAMLISPLMGPIVGVGLGLGIFDPALIRHSLKNLFIAAAISLFVSYIYFALTPLHEAQSELLARTRPTIWDVLIALFGGLAGVIASTRKNISNTIPGVAIATALMPPLCTAGFGLASGNLAYFAGAFYLFIINSVFISISTFLIIRFLKFKPVRSINPESEAKLRRTIWIVAVLTIIPSLYLAYIFVNEEIFRQKANNFINEEIKSRELYVLDKTIKPMDKFISLVVYGREVTDSLQRIISAEKTKYGLADVRISLQQARTEAISTEDLSMLREDIQKQIVAQNAVSIDKDRKIKSLEDKLARKTKSNISLEVYKEFKVIYGEVREFSLIKAPVYSQTGTDTVFLAYIKPAAGSGHLIPRQINEWLKVRLGTEKTKVVLQRE